MDKSGFLLALLFLARFLTIRAGETTNQTPRNATISSKPDVTIYVLTPHERLSLTCKNVSSSQIYWQRDDKNVTEDDEHYKIGENGLRLTLSNGYPEMMGNYSCKDNVSSADSISTYRVIREPVAAFEKKNVSVVEGETLKLICQVPVEFKPVITWQFGGKNYTNSSDRVELKKTANIDNAQLTVANMSMEESGPVSCFVTFDNIYGNVIVNATTYVTVKDKLAALWPFLGICVEVIVLCVIILIYEKKRNKAELDESDTDQSPDTKRTLIPDDYYIPLQGPLPPSLLPVKPQETNPQINSSPDYDRAVHFRSPSNNPLIYSPSLSKPTPNKDSELRHRK